VQPPPAPSNDEAMPWLPSPAVAQPAQALPPLALVAPVAQPHPKPQALGQPQQRSHSPVMQSEIEASVLTGQERAYMEELDTFAAPYIQRIRYR